MPQLDGHLPVEDLARWRNYLNQEYRQPVLYRFFNEDRELLYIGISSNPSDRWIQHRRSKEWWKEVAYIAFTSVRGLRWELELAERQAIRAESPRYNRRSAVA